MLMAERRAAGKTEGAPTRDLFDLMGAARDPETGEAFTDEQLGDQVATIDFSPVTRPPRRRCSGRCICSRLIPRARINWPPRCSAHPRMARSTSTG